MMHRYIKLFITVLLCNLLLSCQENRQKGSTPGNIITDTITINAGKEWLKTNIESFFNNDEKFQKGFAALCTPQYAEFKSDATNVDLDGGMTEQEFKTKWGRRYSPYAGIGEGFMIAGTDYGEIEVKRCDFKRVTEMKGYLFDVVLVDKTFNSKFIRQVVLVKNGDSFLIDNVLEIANEFEGKDEKSKD